MFPVSNGFYPQGAGTQFPWNPAASDTPQPILNYPNVGSALTPRHALYGVVSDLYTQINKNMSPLYSQPLSKTLGINNNPYYSPYSGDPFAGLSRTGYYLNSQPPQQPQLPAGGNVFGTPQGGYNVVNVHNNYPADMSFVGTPGLDSFSAYRQNIANYDYFGNYTAQSASMPTPSIPAAFGNYEYTTPSLGVNSVMDTIRSIAGLLSG